MLGHLLDTEDPGTLAAVQEVASNILRQNNTQLEEGSPAWWGLCDLVNRGLVEQARRGIDRLRGDQGTSHDPLFRAVDREAAGPEPPVRTVPSLEELVGMYLADPTRDAGAKADDDYRLVLRFLSELVDTLGVLVEATTIGRPLSNSTSTSAPLILTLPDVTLDIKTSDASGTSTGTRLSTESTDADKATPAISVPKISSILETVEPTSNCKMSPRENALVAVEAITRGIPPPAL